MAEGGAFVAGAITAKMLLDLTGWSKGLKQVKTDTEKVGGQVAQMGQRMVDAGKAMTAIGGAITGTLFALTKSTANTGDQIAKLSQKTGLSAETLSAYKYAADLAGSSLEGVANGLRRLSSGMLDASRGLATSKESFDELGISVTDQTGRLRPMNDVLLEVADKFSKMEDGTKKAALAQDLFGRSGMDLIPLLNQGREGLAAQLREAERLGIIFTDKTAKGSEAFNDSLETLKASLGGLVQQFTTQIMPALTSFVTGVSNTVAKVTAWAKEHPALAKGLMSVAAVLGGLLSGLGLLTMTVGKLIITFTQLAASVGTTAGAMAASLGAWAAIGVAAFKVYQITTDLISAKERLADADYALFESQQRLGQKLREAADAAGITRREFVALTDKYNGNTAALAMAIKRGQEGKELQTALAKVGAEHAKVVDEQRAKTEGAAGALGNLGTAAQITGPKIQALTGQVIDATAAFQEMADKPIGDLVDRMNQDIATSEIVEVPIELDLDGFGESTNEGIAILDGFNERAAELVGAASEDAKRVLDDYNRVAGEVFGNIITGFGDIIMSSKSMGDFFGQIVTKMIADLGKLVIQEMLFAKKSILADQMKAVASFIASIFKKIPFPLNIVLAAGAFALVSKLFSKLTKFAEGGAFEKPTVIQNAVVGEAGPEYLLPENKLVRIVQNAMKFNPFTAVPTLAPMAATAGGPSLTVNINSPLIQTTGLSRHDLEAAGEELMAVIEGQMRRKGG